jgi:O-antigen ligase
MQGCHPGPEALSGAINPQLRNALWITGVSILAFVLSWQIADGSYALSALTAVLVLTTIGVRLTRLPVDVILVGFLLIGNIVGNRGFAQLAPAPGLPLLPAEIGLAVAVGWRIILCAFERKPPFRSDPLNWAVLAWLVVGTARVLFDVPRFGLVAVRDYAMIYYALFFFLAQHMARDPRSAAYLRQCFIFASILLIPIYALYVLFPDFFFQLAVNGIPLIHYKGDLARTFLAISSIVIFHWARGPRRYWAWPLSVATFIAVAAGENRASLLGVVIASGLLLLARHWRYPALQAVAGAVALLAAVVLASVFDNAWAARRLEGITDRLVSIVDISGTGRYESEDAYYKGDNNRFRFVWWRNVATETWERNPVFGLGFGADLARGFIAEYYPTDEGEFNVRSPHNIFLTVFGRMGLAGCLVWGVFCGVLLLRTWRALRQGDDAVQWSLWAGLWVIMVSSTLGVVLEGPMGAVVFWTMLGLISAWPGQTEKSKPAAAGETDAETAAAATSA